MKKSTKSVTEHNDPLCQAFFEQSPFSTQIFSPNGKTVWVNKAWESLWKVTLAQLGDYNILHDTQLIDLGIMSYIQKGFNGEATHIPAAKYEVEKTLGNVSDHKPRWVKSFIYPVFDTKRQLQQVILIHEDVSEQVHDEYKLKESEERFRTLIEQSTDAIQLVSPEGKIIYSSESIKNVLGYTPDELQGMDVTPFMHPADLSHFQKKFQELLKKPKNEVTLQYRVKHRDGSWAWLETTGVNHLSTPNIHALVGTFRNITRRKEHEQELRYQKTLLEAQREVAPDGTLVVSPEGKMVSYNSRFISMWNFSRDLMAKGEDELALLEATKQLVNPEQFLPRVQQLYKSQASSFDELNFQDGRVFDRYGSPLIGEDGTNYGYVWFFQNVTQRKQLERQKDEFLGIASHELKTPVTSLKAYGQVLQHRFIKAGDEKSALLLGKMDTQINKLTTLIHDLLDISKIEAGRLQFHSDYFAFDEVVIETVEEVQRTTERHILTIQGKTGKTIFGDRERVGQVLTNFLTNAIKHSPYSYNIIISNSVSNDEVVLSVQDFGVGIPKDTISHVFERFYRVKGKTHDTVPGMGLGLYIASEIITRLGGRIWVESEKRKGTTISFALPIKKKTKNFVNLDLRH